MGGRIPCRRDGAGMGVVVIREENPFAEFLKGIQPIGEAYFNRQAERGRANLLNDIDNYVGAKPTVMQASQLGDQWTQGYNPSQATGAVPQGLMDMQNNEALYSQFMQGSGATYPMQEAQQQFAANQAAEKARLIKQGADYFGAQGSQQLITDAENKRRLQDITADPNMSYQDLVRLALSYSAQSNDPKGVLSSIDMLKPNSGLHSVNLGGKTGLIAHDPTGNSPDSINLVDNTLSPGQVQQGQQFNTQQDNIFKLRQVDFENGIKELKYKADLGDNSSVRQLKILADSANRNIIAHQNWMKANVGSDESKSPFYQQAMNGSNFLGGLYQQPGSGGAPMSTGKQEMTKDAWEKSVQNAVSKGLTRQQAEKALNDKGYFTR